MTTKYSRTPEVTDKRPKPKRYFLNIARVVATRATCPRLHVGAVLVSETGNIIGTGYNGAPVGFPHCSEEGCEVEGNHCVRSVHAEVNAIAQAALEGHVTAWATLYCTHTPCRACLQVAVNAGITNFVYAKEYGDTYYAKQLAAIDVISLEHYSLGGGKQ